jgi:hypothetical protein
MKRLLKQTVVILGLVTQVFFVNAQTESSLSNQSTSATPNQQTQSETKLTPAQAPKAQPTLKTYYIEAGSYGTKRETDPPPYTRNLSKSGLSGTEKINWLDVGFDYRIRYEHRVNDIRRPELTTDNPYLLRTRAYIGMKQLIDPFRFAVEFEDARRVNGQFPEDDRDFNRTELIQVYGELYFKKAFGTDVRGTNRPLSIRAGRMAFEALDRRLIAVNQWRNTTNNALGVRAILGQEANDWQLEMMVSQPILRHPDQWDEPLPNTFFSNVIGHWRKWSNIVTIEPYFMSLRRDDEDVATNQRSVNAPGLRLYGWIKNSGLNYDISGMYQFGEYNNQNHRAHAITSEIGYTFLNTSWKPRISAFYGFVSGDKDPSDSENNRFERFFGFARPWSSDDYIIMENVETFRTRLEFGPVKGIRFDGGYGFYWLASATDRMYNLLGGKNNRDITGNSGDFIGHGFDMRVRFKMLKFIDTAMGYSHFTKGEFVKAREEAAVDMSTGATDFAYVELTFNAFDLMKNFTGK